MLYRVVDTYDLHNTVELQPGESYPARCLVEDPSGIRIMIVPDDSPIEAVHWEYAHGDGAQAILRAQPMSFVLMETFVEHRETQGVWHVFHLSEEYWTRCESPLSYLEMADYISTAPAGEETGFVHLHTHSEHSALDGLSTVREMVQAAVADGQRALAITDHGVCAAHPALQLACQQAGIKPIFGLEAYFVDNRHDRGDEHRNDYMHLVLLAMTEQGLLNLWALSTESYRTGQYYKPRIDWDLLEKLGDGIIATTGCLRGPLLHPYLEGGDEEKALQNLSRLKSIFGDRLYIELHVNQLPQQIEGNKWLVEVSEKYNVPLVAVVDSHYTHEHERDLHRTWLSIQTNSDVQDDSSLFAGGQDYHLMTGVEVASALHRGQGLPPEVVDEAILNTGRVADRCTAEMTGKDHNPIYSKPTEEWPDPVAHDVDRLWDLCFERWAERTIGKANSQDEYMARLEREMTLLIDKRFCGYFLMEWDIVMYAKRNGVLVGPGRGSGGGSLVAYLIGITEIDPVEADLLFERFLTDGRTELPDFDIDFPSSKKKFMLDYVASRWGEDHVCTVGTHLRLKNKAVINDTSRAMKSLLAEDAFRDMRAVSAIIDEAEASTAGLGLSWDELWVQAGEVLEPYRQKYPQVFEIAAQLHGRLKTYGKHAAGVIIDPENPLTGALPLRRGEDEEGMISQFDMHALVSLGFVKFDMLNIRNLDTIQDAVDLIRVQTGREITPYTWRDEYRDPQIWGEISDGWTLGMFQIETVSGTRLTRRFRPASLAELSDVITLVRPGPMRSGLTEIYFRRRNGDEEVSYADARLEAILAKTYGTMLYQEDIMAVSMSLAGYDSNEADAVRKILGKKKVELVNEAGEKFVRRSVANGTDREVAEHLWEQMAEFAKYSFGRAHAYAYAMLGFWTGWLKFHYPIQFLTAALSTVKQERVPEFVEEARRMGYNILPPDINESGEGFTSSPGRMAVRYGLKAVKGIGDAAVAAIIENRPYTSWEDFQERKGSKCNSGHIKTLVHIGAMDSLFPNRRALEKLMEAEAVPGSDRCSWKDPATVSEWNGLPCTFDWASEPPPLGRTGKPAKPKPVPKRCTRACRQFAPTPLPDPAVIVPYTDADIRTIEMDTLGVYLSSTPFDRIPEEDRKEFATAADVMVGAHGTYMLAAVLKTVRQKPGGDRNGNAMGWLTLTTERGEIDCVVFHSTWAKHVKHFKTGTMAYVALNKNDRGQTLELFEPLD
jgi:DNA polymerase-3 subunit alpha